MGYELTMLVGFKPHEEQGFFQILTSVDFLKIPRDFESESLFWDIKDIENTVYFFWEDRNIQEITDCYEDIPKLFTPEETLKFLRKQPKETFQIDPAIQILKYYVKQEGEYRVIFYGH